MNQEEDLLARLADAAGCAYLSDLHYLSDAQRERIFHMLTDMKADQVVLSAWNEALAYLGHFSAERDAAAAREKLLHALSVSGES